MLYVRVREAHKELGGANRSHPIPTYWIEVAPFDPSSHARSLARPLA